MALVSVSVVLFLSVSMALANAPCSQRAARDFRPDNNDCGVFYICSMGQLVRFTCHGGGVYDERSQTCVPANSYFDQCTRRMAARQRCPPGTRGAVPHPTQCAQYYDCGADSTRPQDGVRGWEEDLRECEYPLVFSTAQKKCVTPARGLCGSRQEPLDQCDYKVNQCEDHADCVPCHVRFPSCRGLPDGLNAWSGRQGSPYIVTCRQQRVQSTGFCDQEGGVAIFDEKTRLCVKIEAEVEKATEPEPQTTPQPTPSFIPQPVVIAAQGPAQSSGNNGNSHAANLPPFQLHIPVNYQNQQGRGHNQVHSNQNGHGRGHNQLFRSP